MKFRKIFFSGLCLCGLSSLQAMPNHQFYLPNNYFVSVSGVGAIMNSNSLQQNHAALPPTEFVPSINQTNLNYGTGGVELSGGFKWQYNCWGLQSSLNYLYLAGKNKSTFPFYNTDVFSTAFVDNVTVQALTANLGVYKNFMLPFSLYADAGLGSARLATQGIFNINVDSLPIIETHNNIRYNFTWQVGVGILYKVVQHWDINAGLHYANFGPVDFGSFGGSPDLPGGSDYKANNFSAILFSLGVQYS